MADLKKADDGRGSSGPPTDATAEPHVQDPRLIPGGSLKAARTPIGMNAVDLEDLPAYSERITPDA